MNQDAKPITITVNAQDQVFLGNNQIQLSNLVATLQAASQNNTDQRVFVRGDKDVSYGDMLQVMSTITQGGFTKVALLADASNTPPPTGK
jgi:biopolymer transport protein TolR